MRIKWSSDVAEQIIRRLNDAEMSMGDCLREARRAAEALEEANESGESRTLKQLEQRLTELTYRMQRAQRRIDDLAEQTRSTNERFEEAERRISAMIDAADNAAASEANRQQEWLRLIDKMEIMPLLREMTGWYTPEWLSILAGNPQNFMIM